MYAPVQHIIIISATGSLQNYSPDINTIVQFKIVGKKSFKIKGCQSGACYNHIQSL